MNAAGARVAEWKNRRDEESASTATCRQELIQVLKVLKTAREKAQSSLARAVKIFMEPDAVVTIYEELRSKVEQHVGFDINKLARLEAKGFKVTQVRSASVANAEQLALEVLCVSGLAEEAKKFCKRVSSF